MYLTVVLFQLFTQHENETLRILTVGQKLFFLHGDRRVSCKCHSCASISLWPSLVCHVLRMCTVIAIEHNYGVSVLMLYTFSVLMEDASVGWPARPWDALNECCLSSALSFVFFRFDSCLLVRRWIHIIKGINGLAANYEVRPPTQFLDRHCAIFP